MSNEEIKNEENKELTRKETLDKLKKTSKGICKAIDIFRIIFIVGAVLCLVAGIVCIVAGACDWLTTIYEKHPDTLSKAKIDIDFEGMEAFIKDMHGKITLGDLYAEGLLDDLCYGCAIVCGAGMVECLVAYAITFLLKPIFVKLSNDETPFTSEMAKKLKISLIIIAVLVIFQDVLIGLILAAFLACLYFIFLYGCVLQKDDDNTL